MNQVYDPLAYVDRTGAGVSQIGRNVAGTLGQFFQENAQWKQFKAKQGSEASAKKRFYDTAIEVFKERGINPSSINIPLPDDERFATAEDYAENLSKSVEHLFAGSGSRPTAEDAARIGIQNQPGVKESLARQNFLDKNDPMGQINLNGMAGDKVTPQGEYSNANETVNPELYDVLGMTRPQNAQEETGPNIDQYIDPMMKGLVDQVRGGSISADKAWDRMQGILETKEKLRFAEAKDKIDERKERRKAAAQGTVDAYKSGYTPVKEGKTVSNYSPSEVYEDPSKFSVGPIDPRMDKDREGGRGSGRYGVTKDTDLNALYEKLYNNASTFYASDGTGLKDPSFEAPAKQAIRMANVVFAAAQIQNKAGKGNLDSESAIKTAETLVSMKDAVESASKQQVLGWKTDPKNPNGKIPISASDSKSIYENADSIFSELKTTNPMAYNKIVDALKNGYSLREILDFIKSQGLQ